MVSIKDRGRSHVCAGVLIGVRFVLTTGNCVDVVGPNPIVVIGAHEVNDDRRTDGVKEVRVERAHRHPQWTGNIYDGYDVAILQLPRVIDVRVPQVADGTTDLQANTRLRSLVFDEALEMGRFVIVNPELCPMMQHLGPAMFCAYSATLAMQPGSSGGPLLIPGGVLNLRSDDSIHAGQHPDEDLLVGIISCSNFSALDDSGIGCTAISAVRPWIDSIINPQAEAIYDMTNMPVITASVLVILITAFFGSTEAPVPYRALASFCIYALLACSVISVACNQFEQVAAPQFLLRIMDALSSFHEHAVALLPACLQITDPARTGAYEHQKDFDVGGLAITMAVAIISSIIVSNLISSVMGMRGKAATNKQLRQIGGVPHVHKNYIKRCKTGVIEDRLTAAQVVGNHAGVIIEGMPGIGKTALAKAVINGPQILAHFWSGIFWLQAKASAADALLSILQEAHKRMSELFAPGHFLLHREQAGWCIHDYVVAINKMLERRSCLLVLDGAQNSEVLEGIVSLRCALLITSQVRGLCSDYARFKHVEVVPMDMDKSWNLFLKLVPAGSGLKGAEELLQACGGHPLAVAILGTHVQDALRAEEEGSSNALKTMMEEVQDPMWRLQMPIKSRSFLHSPDMDQHLTMARCFDFALDALNEGERKMLPLLAALPRGQQVNTDELGAIWNLRYDEALRMARKLERHSLLQGVSSEGREAGSTLWGMHVLQHDFLKMLGDVTMTKTVLEG